MSEDTDQVTARLQEFKASLEQAVVLTKAGLENVKTASAKMAALADYQHAILPIQLARIDRDTTLELSRSYFLLPEDKALLAQYGLKSESPLKTIFTLGANRRQNKTVLQKIEQREDRQLAQAQAILDAATKAADKKPAKNLKAQTPRA